MTDAQKAVIKAAKEFVREEEHVARDGIMIAHTRRRLIAAVRQLEQEEKEREL